ncbi:hypothetical protein Taro_054429 [Colocasia esculenta]|uniref:Uncharacterized protein n=1 Tax=Colocasia esculenta TaxID=4460 RepID=A0A843XQN3_COLES|nr:hypothetical protein [Colocasia esculenta]
MVDRGFQQAGPPLGRLQCSSLAMGTCNQEHTLGHHCHIMYLNHPMQAIPHHLHLVDTLVVGISSNPPGQQTTVCTGYDYYNQQQPQKSIYAVPPCPDHAIEAREADKDDDEDEDLCIHDD